LFCHQVECCDFIVEKKPKRKKWVSMRTADKSGEKGEKRAGHEGHLMLVYGRFGHVTDDRTNQRPAVRFAARLSLRT
jgi:hypothetical protein